MALKATVQYRGVTISNCYIRVYEFTGDKTRIEGRVQFKASATEAPFAEELRSVPFDPNGGNPLTQFYTALRAEIPGAVDC